MLAIINLESNQLKKIENLSCLPRLETLHFGKNHLSTYEALEHLKELPNVTGMFKTLPVIFIRLYLFES